MDKEYESIDIMQLEKFQQKPRKKMNLIGLMFIFFLCILFIIIGLYYIEQISGETVIIFTIINFSLIECIYFCIVTSLKKYS